MSFLDLCRLWDGVASIPIGTQEQRLRVKKRIMRLFEVKQVVRCFRDSPGYLIIAYRRKRLDDFFK